MAVQRLSRGARRGTADLVWPVDEMKREVQKERIVERGLLRDELLGLGDDQRGGEVADVVKARRLVSTVIYRRTSRGDSLPVAASVSAVGTEKAGSIAALTQSLFGSS